MGNLKNKLSSWRKQIIEVTKRTCKSYTFFDTKPNMIYVQNNSNFPIYISLDSIPTTEKYDFRIKGNSERCIGRPYGSQQIYILNDTDIDMTVPIWSIDGDFDFSILQDFTVDSINIDKDSAEKLVFDGVIKGFKNGVMLPSGNNTIGGVNIVGDALSKIIDIKNMFTGKFFPVKIDTFNNQSSITNNYNSYAFVKLKYVENIGDNISVITINSTVTESNELEIQPHSKIENLNLGKCYSISLSPKETEKPTSVNGFVECYL